ncbi:DUF6364 family protein [Hymenobacter coccineus]|uniref:Uncharacterized protein n=1 Tax=Hymenobacter coccineus TaxID=1908235 RepID=A0A1G1TFK2_9BACT|nr:DUF6364 family protein [Hymenobacter coccineus]OGX89661.1 hypothetical protein BEN49_08615 [Hymenobacter coccineus]
MSTLTLSLDDDLATQVQEYARRTGTDLSVLVAELLRPVVAPARKRRPLSPQVEALSGCISLPPNFDYKTALGEALWEKHQ